MPFGQSITYDCPAGEKLESDQTKNTVDVLCESTGSYDDPSPWPRCADKMECDASSTTVPFPDGMSSTDHTAAGPYYAYANAAFDQFTWD